MTEPLTCSECERTFSGVREDFRCGEPLVLNDDGTVALYCDDILCAECRDSGH